MGEIRFELKNAKPAMVAAFMSTVTLVAGSVLDNDPDIVRSQKQNGAIISIRSDENFALLAKTLFKEFGAVVDPSLRAISSEHSPEAVGFVFEPQPSQRVFPVQEI